MSEKKKWNCGCKERREALKKKIAQFRARRNRRAPVPETAPE